MSAEFKQEKIKKAAVLTYILWTVFTGDYLYAQNQKMDKEISLLWKISGNGLSKPSYLFGTIHMYDTSVFRIPESVYKLLGQCNSLALEVDFGGIDQVALMERMFLPANGETLDELLSPQAFENLMQIPAVKTMGKDAIKRFTPFAISSFIMTETAGKSTLSVDVELYNHAIAKTIDVIGLETMEEQMDIINQIPMEDQIKELEKSLMDNTDPREMFSKLMKAYKNQDFKFFEEMTEGDTAMDPLSSEKLLRERNINMANRVDSILKMDKRESLFVAVGAAHVNDMKKMRGLVSLLKEKGYTLTPVNVKL